MYSDPAKSVKIQDSNMGKASIRGEQNENALSATDLIKDAMPV